MSDLEVFREVDEDYRRERMAAFWRRYGGAAAALVLVIIAIAWGADYYYQRLQAKKAGQSAELNALIATAKDGSVAKSADGLAVYAATADASHALLARLAEAALRQRLGALDKAATIYHQIADDSTAPQDIRDLAVVRLGQVAVDQPKPEPLIPRLQAIADKNSPWRYTALETIALLTAKNGQNANAVKIFTDLAKDPGAPPDLADRAHALAEIYSGK